MPARAATLAALAFAVVACGRPDLAPVPAAAVAAAPCPDGTQVVAVANVDRRGRPQGATAFCADGTGLFSATEAHIVSDRGPVKMFLNGRGDWEVFLFSASTRFMVRPDGRVDIETISEARAQAPSRLRLQGTWIEVEGFEGPLDELPDGSTALG